MLTPVVKSVVHTETITKEVVYPTGVLCQYTLTNGNLSGYSFTSQGGKSLNRFIPPDLLKFYVLSPWYVSNQKFESTNLYDFFKTEKDLLNFKGTSDFYCREETVLWTLNNEIVPLAVGLSQSISFHYYMAKNNKQTMQLFIDFICKLDCVEVIENLEIASIPYYNCDDSKDYAQFCVYKGVIKVDKDLYLKMLRPSSGRFYLCSTSIATNLCNLFFEAYPEHKYKD